MPTLLATPAADDATRRQLFQGVGVLGLGWALTGCGGQGPAGGDPSGAATTRQFTDSLARDVRIPARPERVVTLQDQNALLPLFELGFRDVVGSVGALDDDGRRYYRRMQDHDTTGIEWVGEYAEPDLEAVAALGPDLVLADPFFHEDIADQLAAIAPTVFVDVFDAPIADVMGRFAELTGDEQYRQRLAELQESYQTTLDELAAAADTPSDVVVSAVTDGEGGTFGIIGGSQGAVEEVLRAAGFARPAAQIDGEVYQLGLEELPSQDGDLLLRLVFRQADSGTDLTTSPLWPGLNAVRKGQAHDIDGESTVGTGYGQRTAFAERVTELVRGIDTTGELPDVQVVTEGRSGRAP